MTNNKYQLDIQALSCERGDRLLFEDIKLSLNQGQGVHIAGANGSGKTSLLRIIAGLSQPLSGNVIFNAHDIHVDKAIYANSTCFIGHQSGVSKQLTPRENCQSLMALRNVKPSKSEIDAALDKVELFGFEDELAGTLSAGQQRRIGLAQLLLTKAPLWLLDEPYTALDTLGIDILDKLCIQHLDNKGLLIFASHQPSALDHDSRVNKLLLKN